MKLIYMYVNIGSFQKFGQFSNAAALPGIYQNQSFYLGKINVANIYHIE